MCTRAVYLGPENTVITARSLDWETEMVSNLWVFPRGLSRAGAAGPRSLRWTSAYGSLVATAFDAATCDGINERGLVTNLLYLSESIYPDITADPGCPLVSVAAWAQYVLDSFANVADAVAALEKEPFYVAPVTTPDGFPGTAHLSLNDPTGDSAIFEYVNGELVIHHGKQYQVMTNSPTFDQQLALDAYWQEIGGNVMLPGTGRAADRFARASYYTRILPQTADEARAVAGIFSVIRNCSVPLGVATPGQPNVAATLWRVVADAKHMRYYFESSFSPDIFWVNLADLDFSLRAPVKKLDIAGGAVYAGNVADQFAPAEPFQFL